MKIKVTNRELKECITNVMERIISEGKSKTRDGFDKATKKGNRDGEREVYGDGFKSYDKVHKSQKDYTRKGKGKWKYDEELNEDRLNLSNPYDMEIEAELIPFKHTKGEYSEVEFNDENFIRIKTDIDDIETDTINKILFNFEMVKKDNDTIDGCVIFWVPKEPKDLKGKFINFLREEHVNIIE